MIVVEGKIPNAEHRSDLEAKRGSPERRLNIRANGNAAADVLNADCLEFPWKISGTAMFSEGLAKSGARATESRPKPQISRTRSTNFGLLRHTTSHASGFPQQ